MSLPFLYQTKTIVRSSKSPQRLLERLARPSTCRRCLSQPAQYEQPNATETSFFREKAQAVAARLNQAETSTITLAEQRAFDSLRRLAGQIQLQRQDAPEAPLLSVEPQEILGLFVPSTDSQPENVDEINSICSKYIVSLAKSFNKAIKASNGNGDLAIWAILKQRVFPLLTFLKTREEVSKKERGLAVTALPFAASILENEKRQSASTRKADGANEIASVEAAAESVDAMEHENILDDDVEASAPSSQLAPLPILTRVYPAALLLALRLLTKNYPVSTLTHSLLPHIRSLGPHSYVLGTNTSFYNTILLLRWNVYSSLQELDSLLSEMQHGAVEFDRNTARVLADIADERWTDLSRFENEDQNSHKPELNLGSRGASWWMQPNQASLWPRIEEWRAIINRQLEEKGLAQVHREGSSAVDADIVPKVWL
jgi:hypothetical protein